MTIELPPPDTKHWTARRKAAVVEAVRIGMISLQEACLRYSLSIEEFLSWLRAFEKHGVYGLRTTRLQVYRDVGDSRGQGRGRAAAAGKAGRSRPRTDRAWRIDSTPSGLTRSWVS